MTGAASTSIQISYTTEDGITTEEFVGGYGPPEFSAEVEDVEEYPISSEPTADIKEECLKESSKLMKRSIEFELKMVTLIKDKDDGVRIIYQDEQEAMKLQSQIPNNNEIPDTYIEEIEVIPEEDPPILLDVPSLEEELIRAAQESYEADTKISDSEIEVSENVAIGDAEAEFIKETTELCAEADENPPNGNNSEPNVMIRDLEAEALKETTESYVEADENRKNGTSSETNGTISDVEADIVREPTELYAEADKNELNGTTSGSNVVIGDVEAECMKETTEFYTEADKNPPNGISFEPNIIGNMEEECIKETIELFADVDENSENNIALEVYDEDVIIEEEETIIIEEDDDFNSLSPQLESTPQPTSPEVSNDNRDADASPAMREDFVSAIDFSMAPYDGPPVLSPNYQTGPNYLDMESTSTEIFANCGDEQPPSLTQELSSLKPTLHDFRPIVKRRRRGRKRKLKLGNGLNNLSGKSIQKSSAHKEALHREAPQILIPHSSAEIQERVKNRQRKTTQNFGSSSSFDSSSELGDPQKPLPKINPRRRKLSSESSQSESKRPRMKNGLFIVEKILKKGIINGRPYLFVKWLNYPSSKNTWEPEENFSLDLVAAYEKGLAERGQVPVVEQVKLKRPRSRVQQQPEVKPIARRNSKVLKEKCPGCLSYPVTFTDNRTGLNGFDQGLTYHKIFESFILNEVRCALVEFDEKHCLELLPLNTINERLKAEIKLN